MALKSVENISRTIQATPSSINASKDFYMEQYSALHGSASDTDFALYFATVGATGASLILTPFGGVAFGFLMYLLAEGSPTDLEKFEDYSMDAVEMLKGLAKKLEGLVSPNGIQKFDIEFTYKVFQNEKGERYGVPFKYQIKSYYNANGDKILQ